MEKKRRLETRDSRGSKKRPVSSRCVAWLFGYAKFRICYVSKLGFLGERYVPVVLVLLQYTPRAFMYHDTILIAVA